MNENKFRIGTLMATLASGVALFPSRAFAQAATNSIGQGMFNLTSDISAPVISLIVASCYLGGFALVASGVMRFKDVGDREPKAFVDALLRIAGGAILVALPDWVGAGLLTMFGSATGWAASGSVAAGDVGAVTPCLNFTGDGGGADSGSALTCVAKNMAENVVPIGAKMFFMLFYISGLFLVASVVWTVAKSYQSGQSQTPQGWFPKLVIGFLLCNVPHLMSTIANTMGVTNGVIGDAGFVGLSSPLLAYVPDTNVAILNTYSALIGDIFAILVFFGIWAVWRGITIMKSMTDGRGNGTMGAGLTHMIGGVMLANAKVTTCWIATTLVGAGLGFCN